MTELVLQIFVFYLLAGALFAVAFAWRGAAAIDPVAGAATRGFKILILAGSALLWPLLLRRWISHQQPIESSAHRRAAGDR